jgi:hypothetical protein
MVFSHGFSQTKLAKNHLEFLIIYSHSQMQSTGLFIPKQYGGNFITIFGLAYRLLPVAPSILLGVNQGIDRLT